MLAMVARLFEMIGESMIALPQNQVATEKQRAEDGAIKVTPARRPIWPSCCG